MYVGECKRWVKNGDQLLQATSHDLEKVGIFYATDEFTQHLFEICWRIFGRYHFFHVMHVTNNGLYFVLGIRAVFIKENLYGSVAMATIKVKGTVATVA